MPMMASIDIRLVAPRGGQWLEPFSSALGSSDPSLLLEGAEQYFLGESADHCSDRRSIDLALRLACKRLQVDIRWRPRHEIGRAARLLTRGGGFLICVQENLRTPTLRFAIAHELAHTLGYRASPAGRMRRVVPNSRGEEVACNAIARRILMPAFALKRSGRELLDLWSKHPRKLVTHSQELGVSPWQLALRCLEDAPDPPAVAVVWAADTRTTQILRIKESWSPLGLFVPTKKTLRRTEQAEALPWRAILRGDALSGTEAVGLGSLSGELASIAFPIELGRGMGHAAGQVVFLDEHLRAKGAQWRASHPLGRVGQGG